MSTIDVQNALPTIAKHSAHRSEVIDIKESVSVVAPVKNLNGWGAPRQPIVYTSFGSFFATSVVRFKSLWTRRFMLSLLAGQVVSLCITCTNVTTTELTNRNFNLPTTQTWFLYLGLNLIYTPYTMYRYGIKGWAKMVWRDGYKYILLAACDVEGNFLAVKAYEYTTLLSCMLLDAWAIPVCLAFSWLFMHPKYHWTQILGVVICVAGLGLLVASDQLTGKDWKGVSMVKGDFFMIIGATFYGFTNAYEEFFVRKHPLYEVVGQLGFWGTIINGAQASGLEHKGWFTATWDGATAGLLLAYTGAMLTLYTVAPLLYRMASSAYYNISLLTSDFYGLLFGLFLFHYSPFWLYFPAFSIVVVGLVVYFWHATPEEQGTVDPRAPTYITMRTRGSDVEDVERSNEDGEDDVISK